MKQLQADPWDTVEEKFPIGSKHTGRVTNITDYGAFVELEPGIEGLVHVSEMSWTKKNVHPGKIVSTSQEVEVVVLEIDGQKRRVSLGLKQTQGNPWETFAADPSERHRGRRRDQEHHRVRPVRRSRRRHRRHGPPLATSTGTGRARRRSRTTARATSSRRWSPTSTPRRSASRSRSRRSSGDPFAEAVAGVKRGDIVTVTVTSIEDGGIEVEYDGMKTLHPPLRPQPRPRRAAARALHQGRQGRRAGRARSTRRPASSACRSRPARSPRRRRPWSSTARPTPAPRSATSSARR